MLLVNKHLLLFSTEEKAYYSALMSLCGDRVVLVLVFYLQGSITTFTEGRQGGCSERRQSQAAPQHSSSIPCPAPRVGAAAEPSPGTMLPHKAQGPCSVLTTSTRTSKRSGGAILSLAAAAPLSPSLWGWACACWRGVELWWVHGVPCLERVPGHLPAPGQAVPASGRRPVLAGAQASQ